MAVIHRDTIKCSVVDVGDYTQFETLAVKVVGRSLLSSSSASTVRLARSRLISLTKWLIYSTS